LGFRTLSSGMGVARNINLSQRSPRTFTATENQRSMNGLDSARSRGLQLYPDRLAVKTKIDR
jgi:hypothetical protein